MLCHGSGTRSYETIFGTFVGKGVRVADGTSSHPLTSELRQKICGETEVRVEGRGSDFSRAMLRGDTLVAHALPQRGL